VSEQYYLVSQLPAFSEVDENKKLPITEEYYRELCSRFLDEKSLEILSGLSLVPPRKVTPTGSDFVDEWYKRERSLRFALARVRALRMNKDTDISESSCTADILQIARTAIGLENPLEAERFLNKYRMDIISTISPLDEFSSDAVFAYGLRLMLMERMHKFDEEKGMASYHQIYDRILGENK
jgi:hypothetical protein